MPNKVGYSHGVPYVLVITETELTAYYEIDPKITFFGHNTTKILHNTLLFKAH